MGILVVSVRRFPRWLMGSKESCRLNENGGNQGKATAYCRVPPCKPPRRLLPVHTGNALAYAMGSKNSAYAGASGAHHLARRPDSVSLVAKCGEPLQRGFPVLVLVGVDLAVLDPCALLGHRSIAIAALGACGALGSRVRPEPPAAATPSSPTFRRWQRSISPQLMMRLTTSMKTGWKD